jgi:hypothetical protein
METTEIILHNDGSLTERVIRQRKLQAEQSVLDALTDGVIRNIRNVLTIPDWGNAHASVGVSDTLWSVAIDRIPLNARFRLINNVLVPAFASTTDIEMPLEWRAPKEVRLAFVVRTDIEADCIRITGNWLFACDADKRGYRLPLPNLHDHCLICTGNFDDLHNTESECVIASLEQFRKSKWNADLMRTVEKSQQFFRFKPTNETFETLPIGVPDWTTLCDKVSTDIMERVIL